MFSAGLLAVAPGCRRTPAETVPHESSIRDTSEAFRTALSAAEDAAARSPGGRLDLGRLYHANRRFDAARAAYLPLVDDPVLGPRACHYLADLAAAQANPTGEIHWLRETVRRAPDYVPAVLRLAEAVSKSGDAIAAASAFTAVLRLDPGNRDALLAQARDRLRVNDPAGAAAILEDIIARHPDSSSANALLAQLVAARGEEDRAAALRRQARSRKDIPTPDPWLDEVFEHSFDVDRLAMRFEDAAKAGQAEEARHWAARLEAVAPDHWLVAQIRGLELEQAGDLAGAMRIYRRGLEAGGPVEKLAPRLVHALRALDRTAEAEAAARSALQDAPHSPALLLPLAELRSGVGDSAGAERLLSEVLAFYPRHAAASRRLAAIFLERGDFDRARSLLEDAVRADSGDAVSRQWLGRLAIEAGDAAAAVPHLEEAARLEPSNAETAGLLGLAFLRLGNEAARAARWAEAFAGYDRAIALRPSFGEAYANRARLHLRAGDLARAEESLRPLFAAEPDSPEGLLVLGDIQLAADRPADARTTWNRAVHALADLESDPLSSALARRLAAPGAP